MLGRLVLGGITLAVTGYGIKKYIEKSDKYDAMEEIGFKIIDWLDSAQHNTEQFFNMMEHSINNGSNEQTHTKDMLAELYTLKESFYKETIPYFLKSFSGIRNLPDFNMQQFYKLQNNVHKDTLNTHTEKAQEITFMSLYKNSVKDIISEYHSLDAKTQEEVQRYYAVFNTGVFVLERFLDQLQEQTKESVDYASLTQQERIYIENSYLIAVQLIEFSYSDTLEKNNQFSAELSNKIALFNKLLESVYSSLKNSHSSISNS
jgi:hypothetical protein